MNRLWTSRLSRSILIAIFVTLILFIWDFMREVRLVLSQPVNSWSEDVTADCAVALTGGPNRIREGLDLLSRHAVQKLIISGVHPQAELKNIDPIWPYDHEFNEQDVVLERRSRSTFGNAQQTLPLVEAFHCRDLVLITSRTHMYRALRMFRAEFPVDFPILPRAVISYNEHPSWDETGWEAFKLMFYSVWAF